MKTKTGYVTILVILAVLFLGYHSVYFRRLSTMSSDQPKVLDFASRADSLYRGILSNEQPVALEHLLSEISNDPNLAFNTYGNRLGIGNSAFFMVNCSGKVVEKTDSGITVGTIQNLSVFIDTKFIFGNAIRDASGLVRLTDYKTNADFNKLSEALNAIIREKTIPAELTVISVGDSVQVQGAIKLNKSGIAPDAYTILPVRITKK